MDTAILEGTRPPEQHPNGVNGLESVDNSSSYQAKGNHLGKDDSTHPKILPCNEVIYLHSYDGGWLQVESKVKASKCPCKSSLCNDCGVHVALKARAKYLPAVTRRWKKVAMLTFTIDQANHNKRRRLQKSFVNDPAGAWRYVQDNDRIPRTVEMLYRRGYLKSKHYVCALEFQENGWPHWHVLVEPVEREELDEKEISWIWGLGIAHERMAEINSDEEAVQHAVNYLTKYIAKPDDEDHLPEWVKDFGRIKRFSSSRGLLGKPKKAPESKGTGRGYKNTTIRQRLEQCGKKTKLILEQKIRRGTREPEVRYTWLGEVDMPVDEVIADPRWAELGQHFEKTGYVRSQSLISALEMEKKAREAAKKRPEKVSLGCDLRGLEGVIRASLKGHQRRLNVAQMLSSVRLTI